VQSLAAALRREFFERITSKVGQRDVQLLLLTHLIDDRPVLVEACERIAKIVALIGIEYSNDEAVVQQLERDFGERVLTPTLGELRDPQTIVDLALASIDVERPVVLCEIGGYFAPVIEILADKLGSRLLGVVEDTESGHRAYEHVASAGQLPCPVLSLARSPLKEPEDAIVGQSCVFSVERILRSAGFLLNTRRALVLGYGKVGRGSALALRDRHCHVSVFDVDPARRARALAEGFAVPGLESAVVDADLVLGATGQCSLEAAQLAMCKSGAVLASCSSKDVEFDLGTLQRDFKLISQSEALATFEKAGRTVHLLYGGRPVNFRDGAVIGPFLSLVQGEMLMAISELVDLNLGSGLQAATEQSRSFVASLWLEIFCDQHSGFVRTAWERLDG
jgi:adenosylhomocysteinase